ncbi:MAG: hypothetical protein ACXU86_05240, partial [Archangium sp.]
CRIELSHQDGAASGKTVDELTSLPGLRGQFVVQQLAGEQPPRSVLYLAREGKQLPPLGSP